MGCFGAKCTISGLPIEEGDSVRFLLLTKSPYEDGVPVGMSHFWTPRTYPLQGKYNNYGGVNQVEEGPQRDVWLEAFRYDLVPTGPGDNSRRMRVVKKITWEQMTDALRERRIKVRSHVEDVSMGDLKRLMKRTDKLLGRTPDPNPTIAAAPPVPEGIPTRARVEALLQEHGFQVSAGLVLPDCAGGYLVDKRRFGEIRVRFEGWGRENFDKEVEFLEKVLPVLNAAYVAMMSAGYGEYHGKAEILVRVKPGTQNWSGHPKDKNPSIEVSQVMIREDVWQALLQIHSGGQSISHTYAQIDQGTMDNRYLKVGDAIPFVVGPNTHWHLLGRKGPMSREFLRSAAEFAHIYRLLSWLDYFWHPTTDGHQETAWSKHFEALTAFAEIAMKRAKKKVR